MTGLWQALREVFPSATLERHSLAEAFRVSVEDSKAVIHWESVGCVVVVGLPPADHVRITVDANSTHIEEHEFYGQSRSSKVVLEYQRRNAGIERKKNRAWCVLASDIPWRSHAT